MHQNEIVANIVAYGINSRSRVIKLTLLNSWMRELYLLYNAHFEVYQPHGHDMLGRMMAEHLKELYQQLHEKLMNADKKKYSIKLSSSAALAFIITWQVLPVIKGSLAQVVTAAIIQAIDKASKQTPLSTQDIHYSIQRPP